MAKGPKDNATAKVRNRRVRQEALREHLEAQGHLQHVTEILEILMDPKQELQDGMYSRYDMVIKTKLKLIDKYLPTEKPTTISGDDDAPVILNHIVKYV